MDAQALLDMVAAQLEQRAPQRIGVAVSGGSDSVALLCLLADLAPRLEMRPVAVTVDHRLRPEAKAEIRSVTELCGRLGVDHHIENWTGWDGTGNLQAAAREARYALMADWALGNGLTIMALGHTANDQAETTLMRLARGSGVDGLSAMAPRRVQRGITWVRPLLGARRGDLRAFLRARDIPWIEDPSNDDTDFERVRVRQAMSLLEPLGITVGGLNRTAQRMRSARDALDWQTFLAARDVTSVRLGAVCLDLRRYRTLPDEIARRLLLRAIGWIAASDYPPRSASVETAMEAVRQGRAATLDGVQIQRVDEAMWLFREYAAVEDVSAEVGDLWDDRWYVDGPEDDPDLVVRALGADGLQQVPDWRDAGLPRAAMLAMPGVWMGGELIAAPCLDNDEDWTAQIEGGPDGFLGTLLSH